MVQQQHGAVQAAAQHLTGIVHCNWALVALVRRQQVAARKHK